MPAFRNLAEKKFGRLTVSWPEGRQGAGIVWLCVCKCGTLRHVSGCALVTKKTRSCGCLAGEKTAARNRVHGCSVRGAVAPEYRSFHHAKSRCTLPTDKSYADYGGRGIQFKFASFEEFLAEVGRRPGQNYSIDRIKNSGHYESGNVRWATRKEQNNNQRLRKDSRRRKVGKA